MAESITFGSVDGAECQHTFDGPASQAHAAENAVAGITGATSALGGAPGLQDLIARDTGRGV